MLASALIVFREVFEAGLIVGIVLGATRGVAGRGRFVTMGVVGGLGGAALVAVFAGAIADALDGMGQEVLNGGILLVAALMLAWHTVWMARHGRELAGEMKALGRAVSDGSRSLVALSDRNRRRTPAGRRGGRAVPLWPAWRAASPPAPSPAAAPSACSAVLPPPGCSTAAWSPSRRSTCSPPPTRSSPSLQPAWHRRGSDTSSRPSCSPRWAVACGTPPGS